MVTQGVLSNDTGDRLAKSAEQSHKNSMECKILTASSAIDSPILPQRRFIEPV